MTDALHEILFMLLLDKQRGRNYFWEGSLNEPTETKRPAGNVANQRRKVKRRRPVILGEGGGLLDGFSFFLNNLEEALCMMVVESIGWRY
jgi:hypothetical protein